MRVIFHRDFRKDYKKLNSSEQKRVIERLALFLEDSSNPVLNNHKLRGKYEGLSSINITGDLRAFYRPVKKDIALFILVDTHSNLYE